MRAYVPGEQPTTTNLVKLNTNENPYPCSPLVVEAVAAEARRLALYPSPSAEPLRLAAAKVYGLEPERILVGNGSDELLAILLRACVGETGSVAYAVPTYSLYRTLAESVGARIHEVEAVDTEVVAPALRDAAAAGALIFVCTPNSPTGRTTSLEEIAALADGSQGIVVVDEAYVDFGAASALALLASHDNLVVIRTFSKSFSLAGLRLGLLFASDSLVGELAKVKDSYNVSRLAIAAGVAALEDLAWMQSNVARVRATRVRVTAALRAMGYPVEESAANFLWVDCARHGGGKVIYDRLREAGVLVRYFDVEALRHGVRVSIGTDDDMDRFLGALGAVPASAAS